MPPSHVHPGIVGAPQLPLPRSGFTPPHVLVIQHAGSSQSINPVLLSSSPLLHKVSCEPPPQPPNFQPAASLAGTSSTFTHWSLLSVLHIDTLSNKEPQRTSTTLTVVEPVVEHPLASVTVTV